MYQLVSTPALPWGTRHVLEFARLDQEGILRGRLQLLHGSLFPIVRGRADVEVLADGKDGFGQGPVNFTSLKFRALEIISVDISRLDTFGAIESNLLVDLDLPKIVFWTKSVGQPH